MNSTIITKTATKFGDAAAAIIYMRSIKDFIVAAGEISPATVSTVEQVYGVSSTITDDEISNVSTYLKIPGTIIEMLECPLDEAAGMANIAEMYSALKSKYNLAIALCGAFHDIVHDASSAVQPNTAKHPSLVTMENILKRVTKLSSRASVNIQMLEDL